MPDTAVVFYCKECQELIYACKNIPERLKSEGRDIINFIKQEYKLSEIPMEEVSSRKWCSCEREEIA